jgi:hypothetical protein
MRLIPLFLAASLCLAAAEPKQANRVLRVALTPPVDLSTASLSANDFTAELQDGSEARVTGVLSPKDPLLLLVVMDVAGDLALVDPGRVALIQRASEMPKSTHVGLLRAQDGLQVLLDPTSDRKALESALMSMPVTGKAGLLDTVESAVELGDAVAAKASVRLSILYVTDSIVRNYREDFTNPVINSSDSRDLSRKFPEGLIREKISRLRHSLTAYQTAVNIVHLSYSSERLNQAYQVGLTEIASSTGGSAVFCHSVAEIPGTIARMLEAISSQYVVHVALPPGISGKVGLSISARGRQLPHRSHFSLR